MTSPSTQRLAVLAALLVAGAILVQAAEPGTTAQAEGDLWEVTSEMSMEGMPMKLPSQTQRVCSAKEWKEPPGPKDDRLKCQTTEFNTAGPKSTWKVRCAGPPAMTGEGEITRSGPDAYTGQMKFASPDGAMAMKLTGRRVGACDPGESARQVAKQIQAHEARAAQAERMTADAQAEACRAAVSAMNLHKLQGQTSMCADPALKTEFCKRLETREGFDLVASCGKQRGDGAEDEAAYCGKDAEAIQTALCKGALAQEAREQEALDFLGRCCSVQAQAIAQRECAGRQYTSMAESRYATFCVNYARDAMAGGTAAVQEPTEPAEPETKKGKVKKGLKGLFGK